MKLGCLVTFDSIHQVLRAEKLLLASGLRVDTYPVPREVSSDCGIALDVRCEDMTEILEQLAIKSLEPEGTYRLVDDRYVPFGDVADD
jgi:hypothetical protein